MKVKILTSPPMEIEGTPDEIFGIIRMNTITQRQIVSKKTSRGRCRHRPWSLADVLKLKIYYNNKIPIHDIAEIIGRSENSIEMKIVVLLHTGELERLK